MTRTFSYKGLFSSAAPTPMVRRGWGGVPYDFGIGLPDPESLPLEGLAQAAREALLKEGRELAHYPPMLGHTGLRELVVSKMEKERGARVSPEQVLITNGAMQALVLLFENFINQGDIVLTEEFTFAWSLRVLQHFRANVIGVPVDEGGLRPDALGEVLSGLKRARKRPKFLYTMPTFHNPLGTEISLERRRKLLDTAYDAGLPIIEDDCYYDLRYEGERVPPLFSLDNRRGLVSYVSSFSKIVAPGVRLGWVTAPEEVMSHLLATKLDAGTSFLSSMIVHQYLRGHMEAHVEDAKGILKGKRDAMLSALGEYFGTRARWSQPRGGMYIWVELPQESDVSTAQEEALSAGVSYNGGRAFSPDGKGQNFLRLCFAYASIEAIDQGIKILGQVFERAGLFSSPRHGRQKTQSNKASLKGR